MIVNLYSSIITYLPSVSGRRTDSWRMHSPEWQRLSCILSANPNAGRQVRQKTSHGYPPSNRQPWHKPNLQLSLHPPYSRHKYGPRTTAQVGKPQCPQFKPCVCSRVPIIITHSACKMLSASRRKNFIPCSSTIATIFSDSFLMSSPVTSAASITSIPFPFGAVRATVSICLATSSTCSWRQSRSFCIIVFLS